MDVVLVVIVSLVALVGWILSLAGISGTWLVLLAAIGFDVFHDWSWDFVISTIIFGLLCVAAEVVEFISGLLGAKAFGGSRSAQIGAFLGTLAGGLLISFAIPIPIVGTILGVVLGGFVGALLGELRHQRQLAAYGEGGTRGENVKKGLKAGAGAMIARVVSIAIKAALSTLMVAWLVVIIVLSFRG